MSLRSGVSLVRVLRVTAERMASGAPYRWTHMGSCNCGHLAQTVSALSAAAIHRTANDDEGDWREQVMAHARRLDVVPSSSPQTHREPTEVELCPTTGRPLDAIIDSLLDLGLTHKDLADLERLSAPMVLQSFPAHDRAFDHRVRGDVIRYMRRWADLLERRIEAESLGLAPPLMSTPQVRDDGIDLVA